MNEQILELNAQADKYAWEKVGEKYDELMPQWEDTKMEKFVELMVLEMCKVLDKAQWDKGEDWVCKDGTRIIPQIKEHFGVEE